MHDNIYPRRLTRSPLVRLLAIATLATAFLVEGCGGSSPRQTAATLAGPSTRAATTTGTRGGASSSGSTAPGADGSGALAFARCMRANGVPNFPDPNPGRGALFNTAGIDTAAPAFMAASVKCHSLTGGGPPGPGSTTHPSAQTLAKLLRIARCMRQHGVPQFPDPQTSFPSNPAAAGTRVVTDFDGAILLFPSTIDMQAPAYKKALTACGAPPLGLPH